MRGDGFRRRHDKMKLCLRSLLIWAGIPVTCEVFNLFADCIPQAGLARIERGRRRQGVVPNFKIQGEQGEGDVLCELKCMSASASRYPQNRRDGIRATDRRADGLSADYARKAAKVDQEYGGTPVPGPRIPGAPAPPRMVGNCDTSETALLITISKFRKHFSIQTTPQNLGKITSETTFGHWKMVIRPFCAKKEFLRKYPQSRICAVWDSEYAHTVLINDFNRVGSPFRQTWSCKNL